MNTIAFETPLFGLATVSKLQGILHPHLKSKLITITPNHMIIEMNTYIISQMDKHLR